MIKKYSAIQKMFHWLIALIVIPMVIGSFYIESLPEAYRGSVIMLHKSFGILILCLMILRLIYLLKKGRPSLPTQMRPWERILSQIVQYSFYLALILMPLCGWVMSAAAGHNPVFFNWVVLPFPGIHPDKALSDWFFSAHETIAFVILGLLVLHLAGAFKHYFIDRDLVVQKMLPFRK